MTRARTVRSPLLLFSLALCDRSFDDLQVARGTDSTPLQEYGEERRLLKALE